MTTASPSLKIQPNSRQGLNSGIDSASFVSFAAPLFDRTLAIPHDDPSSSQIWCQRVAIGVPATSGLWCSRWRRPSRSGQALDPESLAIAVQPTDGCPLPPVWALLIGAF